MRVAVIYNSVYLKHYPAALADFNKVIELVPNKTDDYADRGGIYYEQKNYQKAIPDHTKVLGLSPDNITAFQLRGASFGQ